MCEVKRVTSSNQNRHLFRQLARESCGEIFDVPEGDRVIFSYDRNSPGKPLVGVACFTAARRLVKEPTASKFLDNFFHLVTYIFVRPRYKGQGIGGRMIEFMEREMLNQIKRPMRVQSAIKAARFFESHGYIPTGEVVDCVCGGSPLFSTLINMEKPLPS